MTLSHCHLLNTRVSHTRNHIVNITLSPPQLSSVKQSTSHCHAITHFTLSTYSKFYRTVPNLHIPIRKHGISNYQLLVSPPLVPTRTEQTIRVYFQYRLLLLVTTALLYYDITTFSIGNVCKL